MIFLLLSIPLAAGLLEGPIEGRKIMCAYFFSVVGMEPESDSVHFADNTTMSSKKRRAELAVVCVSVCVGLRCSSWR